MKHITLFYLVLFFLVGHAQYKIELVKDGFDVGSNGHGPENFIQYKGKMFFTGSTSANGTELWISDGTPAGTTMFKDISAIQGTDGPYGFIVYNDLLFFSADDGIHGRELWVSDGTALGTNMFLDINPGQNSSGSYPLGIAGSKLFFGADNGISGYELWATDGTASGTYLVKDINPTAYLGSDVSEKGVELNGQLLFSANDGIHGMEPWISDGTPNGTRLLKDLCFTLSNTAPAQFFSFKDYSYFSAPDSIGVNRMWQTNGTDSSTVQLLYVTYPSRFYGDSTMGLFFSGNSPWEGNELFLENNAQNDTYEVELDCWPGANSSDAAVIGKTNNGLILALDNGVYGTELALLELDTILGYSYNLIGDLNPGTFSSVDPSWAGQGCEQNGKLFYVGNDNNYGNQIWVTDGTINGTRMVMPPFNPGTDAITYGEGIRIGYNNAIYFVARYPDYDLQLFRIVDSLYPPLSVQDLQERSIDIFPNPASDVITVDCEEGELALYNSVGFLIRKYEVSVRSSIPIDDLPSGLYFIENLSKGKIYKGKFIRCNR